MAERNDPGYRLAAAELYRLNVERLKTTLTIQSDYGKWLIATLSLVHTGALYAIATGHLAKANAFAFVPFLTGLILTLASGLITWTNFSLNIRLMENWTDPFMLSDDSRWPEEDKNMTFWLNATMIGAIVCGVLAAACIVWGAIALLF